MTRKPRPDWVIDRYDDIETERRGAVFALALLVVFTVAAVALVVL